MKGMIFILAPVIVFSFILVQGYTLSPGNPERKVNSGEVQSVYIAKSPTDQSAMQLGFFSFKTTAPASTSCTPTDLPAINMLLDTSGSMDDNIPGLRTATRNFVAKLKDDNIIGIEEFSDDQDPRTESARVIMEMDKALVNKPKIDDVLKKLVVDPVARTHMKDAFIITQDLLEEYQSDNSNSKVALIFLSDGKPDVDDDEGSDYDAIQDPSEIATEMKSKNIEIFTVGVGNGADKNLMEKLASSAGNYFPAARGENIDSAFTAIFNKLSCQ